MRRTAVACCALNCQDRQQGTHLEDRPQPRPERAGGQVGSQYRDPVDGDVRRYRPAASQDKAELGPVLCLEAKARCVKATVEGVAGSG